MTEKVVSLLQELIRNSCVNDGSEDSGNETRSARSLENFFKSYGIKSEILEPRPGRGSIVARIPGTDPQAPSLMIMGHTDVVPVNPGEWSCDPFGGELRGDYIYGRGAVDMLNMTAAGAVAFAEAAQRYGPFPGDFVFLGEADEEASGQLGARWLVEEHWDKVKADYIVTEGGGYFIQTPRGSSISIGVGEKGLAFTRLRTKGVSGHGSMPYKANSAVLKIARAIQGIETLGNQVHFTPPYRAMIDGLRIGSSLKYGLSHKWSLSWALKKLYAINPGLAKQFHAISRMTMSPNVIRAGQKINIIPDKGEIELDIRILPGQTIEDVYREVKRALGSTLEDEFDIEIIDFFPSNVSSLDTPLAAATYEIAGMAHPGVPFVPFLFSAVTDARFWRMKGSTVYGFSLFDKSMSLTEYSRNIHGADERISLKSLELTANYFFRLPETFFRLSLTSPS